MCDFISWIELTKDGTTDILFLTDAEVYDDPHGKKRLRLCRHNDLIGHGAIRCYYGLGPNEGVDREERCFWRVTHPPAIAEKLANFDTHWGRMFSNGVFTRNDLLRLIANAPLHFQRKAWEQLLKQEPLESDLADVVALAPRFAEVAWQELLKKGPSCDVLCDLICDAPPRFKAKAWQELLKWRVPNEMWRSLIYRAHAPYKAKAWEQLLKGKPHIEMWRHLIINARAPYKAKAWEQLRKRCVSGEDLLWVANHGPKKYAALAETALARAAQKRRERKQKQGR